MIIYVEEEIHCSDFFYIKLMDCWILDKGIQIDNRLIVYLYFILKVCIRKVVLKND